MISLPLLFLTGGVFNHACFIFRMRLPCCICAFASFPLILMAVEDVTGKMSDGIAPQPRCVLIFETRIYAKDIPDAPVDEKKDDAKLDFPETPSTPFFKKAKNETTSSSDERKKQQSSGFILQPNEIVKMPDGRIFIRGHIVSQLPVGR